MPYIGVIRGDMPGPIAIMDLEPVSQYNPPTEPRGQDRRFGRPTPESVGAAMSVVPAGIAGTVDVSAGLAVTGSNNTLSLKVDAAASAFSDVTVAVGAYATAAELAAAANLALGTVGASVTVTADGLYLVLQSQQTGVGSYIESGTGTFNTAAGFSGSFEMPEPATAISAMLPLPSGPLDVSEATVLANFGAGGTPTQRDILIGSIAPYFVETEAFKNSVRVGMISGYLSDEYNPDPHRLPALTAGPAITIVEDDGTTEYEADSIEITAADVDTPNTGDLTITGTALGNTEYNATAVRLYSADGSRTVKLSQQVIQSTTYAGTEGLVSDTSIVLPASLLMGLGVSGSTVIVQYTSLASNLFEIP